MGLSSPQKLHADVSKGEFKGIYYFYGAEDYRIAEAIKYLTRQFLPDKQISTNFRRLDGRGVRCADLMTELSVFPMLGERQAFAVSDFQSYQPTEIERVLKLLQPADPNRIVILTSPSQRTPKKKSAFLKKMVAVTEMVEFGRLTPEQVAAKVSTRLSQAGLNIEPDALSLLTGLLAGNRGALEMEVNKLVDYKQPGDTITSDDIEKMAAGYQAYTVFELADHVVSGDRLSVLSLIRRLLGEGSSATGLLFFLGQHFVSLYLVKAGKPLEPYRRRLEWRFRNQAGRYELGRLERILVMIAEADAALRTRRSVPELELDRLVLQMMEP